MPSPGDVVTYFEAYDGGFDCFSATVTAVKSGNLLDLSFPLGTRVSIPWLEDFPDDPKVDFWSFGERPEAWPQNTIDLLDRVDVGFIPHPLTPRKSYTRKDDTWRFHE